MTRQDRSLETVATFDRLAERYRDRFFGLTDYDCHYQKFLDTLPVGAQAVVDIACGPGNVAAYVRRCRPELAVVGLDLAPSMVALARALVPSARFTVMDCRELSRAGLGGTFQGAIFAFGLSYLEESDVARFFAGLASILDPGASLLLTTITSALSRAGYEVSSTGDEIYTVWRTPQDVLDLVTGHGYEVESSTTISSPAGAAQETQDLVVVARKRYKTQ